MSAKKPQILCCICKFDDNGECKANKEKDWCVKILQNDYDDLNKKDKVIKKERNAYKACLEAIEIRNLDDMVEKGVKYSRIVGEYIAISVKSIVSSRKEVTNALQNAIGMLTLYTSPTDELAQSGIQSLKDVLFQINGDKK